MSLMHASNLHLREGMSRQEEATWQALAWCALKVLFAGLEDPAHKDEGDLNNIFVACRKQVRKSVHQEYRVRKQHWSAPEGMLVEDIVQRTFQTAREAHAIIRDREPSLDTRVVHDQACQLMYTLFSSSFRHFASDQFVDGMFVKMGLPLRPPD